MWKIHAYIQYHFLCIIIYQLYNQSPPDDCQKSGQKFDQKIVKKPAKNCQKNRPIKYVFPKIICTSFTFWYGHRPCSCCLVTPLTGLVGKLIHKRFFWHCFFDGPRSVQFGPVYSMLDIGSKTYESLGNVLKQCPNIYATPLLQWSFWQCLSFSWTILRGKHCWHAIAVMEVVDSFHTVTFYRMIIWRLVVNPM